MNYLDTYDFLKKNAHGYMAKRVMAEIGYAHKVSKVNGGRFDTLIENVLESLSTGFNESGAVTDDVAAAAEERLSEMSAYAKEFSIICAAHAHIDMNWMWDFPETVAITIETMRTMLDLMSEYPDFRFSQSQASIYRIVEKHDPDMLEEIKQRVKEGRWEVTASTWVEADKNLGSGESQARHILYTKRYLEALLDLSPDRIDLDYEPDTFGHSAMIPEILSKGGIKFYYHCRGYEGHHIYRWKAPSGASVIAYREPVWYNEFIEDDMALFVPEFCRVNKIQSVLKVYGVGDHGGGPTRRDLERIMDMQKWPVYPNITFGTYGEFFRILEGKSSELPVVEGELNAVFTGCYTSQSRIKKANKTAEAKLVESEAMSAMAAMEGLAGYDSGGYFGAWERVLFNQFHDILPGSGVIETREFALGNFQQSLAESNSIAIRSLRAISREINTSNFPVSGYDQRQSISEGAGVGFGLDGFNLPVTERGRGIERVFHLFNPTQFERCEVVEATVWDWEGDPKRLLVNDDKGNEMMTQLIDDEPMEYWMHRYFRFLVRARVPAFGYSTYCINQADQDDIAVVFPDWPRMEETECYVMENEQIRAEFNPISMALVSLKDKKKNNELIGKGKGGLFNLVHEDTTKGMSSWVIGRYKKIVPLEEGFVVKDRNIDSLALRQWISFEGSFNNSTLKVKVSLDKDKGRIDYDVTCDWHEKAEHRVTVPQLNFSIPTSGTNMKYIYDIPFGSIERKAADMDMPGLCYAAAFDEKREGLMILSGDRYGFRCTEEAIALSLIRGSTNPDPYPEHGNIKMKFAIASCPDNEETIRKMKNEFIHSITVLPGQRKKGKLPAVGSYLSVIEGQVSISCMKISEDDPKALVIRVCEMDGRDQQVTMNLKRNPVKAFFADLNEKVKGRDIGTYGNSIVFDIKANKIETLMVMFR